MLFPLAPPVDDALLASVGSRSDNAPLSFGPSAALAAAFVAPQRQSQHASKSTVATSSGDDRRVPKRPRTDTTLLTQQHGTTGTSVVEEITQEAAVAAAAAFKPYAEFAEGSRVDYQGRSFTHAPLELSAQRPETAANEIPKKLQFALKGHTLGLQCLQWFPRSGHLLFSADLAGEVRLWDFARSRKQICRYVGHSLQIKSLQVRSDGKRFSSGSVDGFLREWDVESGELLTSLRYTGGRAGGGDGVVLPCLQHLYHPSDESNLILAAVAEKLILWDLRVSSTKIAREYLGCMAPILNVTFLDEGRKILTTAEDKTLRTWDFRVPIQITQFADAAMHAMPHVVHHPTEPFLAAQSLDNRVVVFQDSSMGKLKFVRDRVFSGHVVSGTTCQLSFSPDGRWLSSGDITGKLFVWNWKTGKQEKMFQAHSGKMLVAHLWHPIEASRVVTSAWDGLIKAWS